MVSLVDVNCEHRQLGVCAPAGPVSSANSAIAGWSIHTGCGIGGRISAVLPKPHAVAGSLAPRALCAAGVTETFDCLIAKLTSTRVDGVWTPGVQPARIESCCSTGADMDHLNILPSRPDLPTTPAKPAFAKRGAVVSTCLGIGPGE